MELVTLHTSFVIFRCFIPEKKGLLFLQMSKKLKVYVDDSKPPYKSFFGTFGDAGFITTGATKETTDSYSKVDPTPSRYLGKNLVVSISKSGRMPNTYFENRYLTMASSEQTKDKTVGVYDDPGRTERQQRNKSKDKNIVPQDFRTPSFPKQSTGPGSYVGSFQAPFPHMQDYKVQQRDEPPQPVTSQPANVKTAPGKKGTFGYIGTTFSKVEGVAKGKEDIYDEMRRRETDYWKKSKEKDIGQGKFRIAAYFKKTFDEKVATGVPAVFDRYDAPEDGKKKKKDAPASTSKPGEGGLPSFKYPSAPKSGELGCFGKFPNAPYVPKEDGKKKGAEKKEKEEPKPLGGVWRPVSNAKTGVSKSLLRKFY